MAILRQKLNELRDASLDVIRLRIRQHSKLHEAPGGGLAWELDLCNAAIPLRLDTVEGEGDDGTDAEHIAAFAELLGVSADTVTWGISPIGWLSRRDTSEPVAPDPSAEGEGLPGGRTEPGGTPPSSG